MSEFRTIVSINSIERRIQLKDGILTAGSCFSDAIGKRLEANKFPVLVNPSGIIYNPVSIHNSITGAMSGAQPEEKAFVNLHDITFNYHFHSSFSGPDKGTLSKQIEVAQQQASAFVKGCSYIMLTYGTAWVYRLKETNEIVANCHKQSSSLFKKTLLSCEDVIESFRKFYVDVLRTNPEVRILLTVSPVRHLKETLQLNSVSKAILRTACHYLAEEFSTVEYFPAYEIMMDDLRDYRFFKADMLHPNEQAEEYIWNIFSEKYLDNAAQHFIREWKKISTAMKHKSFHPSSSGHQIFLLQLLKKLGELQHIVNVDEEMRSIQAQLLNSSDQKENSP